MHLNFNQQSIIKGKYKENITIYMKKYTNINIVYASETGTAYDLAKQFIFTFAYKLNYNLINIHNLENFQSYGHSLWIFFISTTGQGDQPYSMKKLWKKMMKKHFENIKNLKFAIYALGDRSYGDNFCLAARKFRQRLINLQAQQIVQIGLGDDQQKNGYLQQYQQVWFPKIKDYIQNSLQVKSQKLTQNILFQSQINSQKLFRSHIVSKKQVCQNKGRRTFFIDLQLQGNMDVKIGDILCLYPHNNPSDVVKLFNYFNINSVEQNKCIKCLGGQYSPSLLFRQMLNISSYVNHTFFVNRPDLKPVSSFTQNQMFKEKLEQLQTDFDQYHNYIKKYKRNVIQVIEDFQIKMPLNDFLQRIGLIAHRKYSISQIINTQNTTKNTTVRLLIRLAQQKISQFRLHYGLCTHDLTVQSQVGSIRKAQIIQGEFQYKQTKQNRILLMTLGTGIAPFIQLLNNAKNSKYQWEILLYYTNRFKNQLYHSQLIQTLQKKSILKPFISYTGEGGKRIMRLIEDNLLPINQFYQKYTESVQNNVDAAFKIMICGPKTTCQAIQNILQKSLNLDIKMLKKKKVLVYQNW